MPLSVFKYFSRKILFSRAFQDSPVFSSTFQACSNPAILKYANKARLVVDKKITFVFIF